MGSDKFSPSSSGSSGFPKGTGKGGNGALKSKFVETASSAKGITECNKALEANSAAINATEKSILLLKEQLQNYTNSMMKSGGENANAFDAENEIAEYKEQIESAEKKREQLQETRKDLIKKLKKYKDRARQEKQQQEKLRQQNEAKKKNNGNYDVKSNASKTSSDALNSRSTDKLVSEDAKSIKAKEMGRERLVDVKKHELVDKAQIKKPSKFDVTRTSNVVPNGKFEKVGADSLKAATKGAVKKNAGNKGKAAAKRHAIRGLQNKLASQGVTKIGVNAAGNVTATTTSTGGGVVAAGGTVLAYIGVALAVILAFILLLLIIIAILVFLEPIGPDYTLKEAVYVTEQHYHAQILDHVNDFFYDENEPITEADITYINNSLNWKEILAYWYVLGCARDGTQVNGETFEFSYHVDADSVDVYDMVRNLDLSDAEIALLTESYSALNTIITYPDERYELLETDRHATHDEAQAHYDFLVSQGLHCEWRGDLVFVVFTTHKGAIVNVEHTDLLEYAEERLTPEMYQHIQNCLTAVDRNTSNGRSYEPTFYDIWMAIKESTAINTDGRSLLVREAYATWIISGCGSATTGGWSEDARNAYGVSEPLEYTFYRELPGGNASACHILYWNTEGNTTDNVTNVLPWLTPGQAQHEEDIPVFLNSEYTYGGNTDILYSSEGLGRLGYTRLGSQTYYNSFDEIGPISDDDDRHSLYCSDMDWNTYCYHVCAPTDQNYLPGMASNAYWCAAYISSLACNFYPYGCFFTHRDYFINSENPAWTVYNADETDSPWGEAHEGFLEALGEFVNISSFGDFCLACTDLYYAGRDTALGLVMADYMDALELTAHTDYYRVQLTNHLSRLPVGLYNRSITGDVYPPDADDDSGYAPDPSEFDDWLGMDVGSVVRFDTYAMNNGGRVLDHTGHLRGWYAPNFTYDSAFGEDMRADDLFSMASTTGGLLAQLVESLGEGGSTHFVVNIVGDNILSTLIDLGIVSSDDYRTVLPQYIESFQSSYCNIFGEILEEQQGLFPYGETYCPDYLEHYRSHLPGCVLYGNDYCSDWDLYEPTAGDIVLFDWADDETGLRDGIPDHIGIIAYADGSNNIYVLDGNGGSAAINAYRYSVTDDCICAIAQIPYGGSDELE